MAQTISVAGTNQVDEGQQKSLIPDNIEIKDPNIQAEVSQVEEMVDKVLGTSEIAAENNEEEDRDTVEQLTSVSQVKPTKSQISKMTGRTYISELQKQLEAEKQARESLEEELSELKKVSSEILSHLSEIKADQKAKK